MTTTLDRAPGWDAVARKQVRLQYGSLRNAASHLNIDVSDIPRVRAHGMKVWSRMVQHHGSTEALLEALEVKV